MMPCRRAQPSSTASGTTPARVAPSLRARARPVSTIAPRVRRPRWRLLRGAAESAAAGAVLRRGAADRAPEVSRRRPARPPILRAGPAAYGAHGHQLAAPVHAREAPTPGPAE